MTDTLYPDVKVRLIGEDGNAFSIIGRVSKALRAAGYSEATKEFSNDAMSGDYDHLLQTVLRYVSVSDDDDWINDDDDDY